MSDKRILIGPSSFGDVDPAPKTLLKDAGYDIVDNPYKRKLAKKELLKLLTPGVIGLIAGLEALDEEVLGASSLKALSRVGSGVSNVDLDAAKRLGILVRSTPTGPVEAVAELTVGAMLSLLRMIPAFDKDMHAGSWKKRFGSQIQGKTVALVGFGKIGRRVAELLAPFGADILAVDPALTADDGTVRRCGLKDALARADIVSLHCAGDTEIIGSGEIESMKPGAYLLNAARGGLVNETALCEALRSGKLAGAWLDVFSEEPYAGPLTALDNALLTPHVGSYSKECRVEMETEAARNLLEALA